MKQLLLRAAALILIGISVNVAVAWSCALWSVLTPVGGLRSSASIPPELSASAEFQAWIQRRYPEADSVDIRLSSYEGVGVQVDVLELTERIPWANQFGPSRVRHSYRTGWPLAAGTCVGYIEWTRGGVGPARPAGGWRWGMAPPAWLRPGKGIPAFFGSDPVRPLPLRPLLAGFIVDSLLWATVAGVVLLAPGWMRRMLRHRRNACRRCGYDLAGLSAAPGGGVVCPECGHAAATKGTA